MKKLIIAIALSLSLLGCGTFSNTPLEVQGTELSKEDPKKAEYLKVSTELRAAVLSFTNQVYYNLNQRIWIVPQAIGPLKIIRKANANLDTFDALIEQGMFTQADVQRKLIEKLLVDIQREIALQARGGAEV